MEHSHLLWEGINMRKEGEVCHGKNLAHPDVKLIFLDKHERVKLSRKKKTARLFFNEASVSSLDLD